MAYWRGGPVTALNARAYAQSPTASADGSLSSGKRDAEAKRVFEVGRAALEAGRF